MDLKQVKHELEELGKAPVAQKMFPITSDWVPITDVLAVINRFEKYWKQYKEKQKTATETKLIDEIFGQS